ncbi:MerR family transcriptional regulator [Thalassovita sp.]|uniref:MerR family transcriptional regulator n=1 Tax=Thalassovita sp. TaxID=1979401 RepID=UPI002B27B3BD|nr:MerR family transcriptional regulator [Thalassovita sp.]
MAKSPDAFRTISEVAEWLDRPAHVLRFWESKFSQVKPVKRAGGRRYYRPQDMLLLGGIKKLLHDDGMTIKGVQKMLREQGVHSVAELSQPLDVDADTIVEATANLPESAQDAASPDDALHVDEVETAAAMSVPEIQPVQDTIAEPESEPAPVEAVAADKAPKPQQATLFDIEPESEPATASDAPDPDTYQAAQPAAAPLIALLARQDRWTGENAEKARSLLQRSRSHAAALRDASKQG